MTEELLNKANFVKKRIDEVNKLLYSIGEEQNPLCLQAGVQNPVEFYLDGASDNPLADLDAEYYKQFIMFLEAYKTHAEKVFNNLGEEDN